MKHWKGRKKQRKSRADGHAQTSPSVACTSISPKKKKKEEELTPDSFLPMRITRLPHLSRETRRRHDRLRIIIVANTPPSLPLIPGCGALCKRSPRGRNGAPFNLELARLALFLRGQRSAGPDDRAVAGGVAAHVCLKGRE